MVDPIILALCLYIMIKKILLLLLTIVLFADIYAVPANNVIKKVIQPDGTTLSVVLCGDDRFHYYATKDRLPLIKTENEAYCYLNIQQHKIVSTGIIAHESENRTSEEKEFIEKNLGMIHESLSKEWQQRMASYSSTYIKTRGKDERERKHLIGKAKGLVVLVEFADKSMTSEKSRAFFNRQFNEIGYSENHHIGSVHDYFYDQSYGQFDLTFDVVGPVAVNNKLSYYGSNRGGDDGNDRHPGEMVAEACKLIDNIVDFSDYDWDGDGEVEQVLVIFAGYGEANGADANTIWPHKSSLNTVAKIGDGDGAIVLDGVMIDTYACTCELAGYSGATINGIGTACHEFSHCLGLPDFYDVGYSGGFGMSYWDLMATGSHSGPNNNGEVPCGYSAYEKWFAGWLDYVELDEAIRINEMPNIGDEPIAYAIYNNNNRNEYYLLENRQNKGWYSYVQTSNKCHGLLVTHVDYDQNAWARNNVNTSSKHQRMSIIPADNSYGKLTTYEKLKNYVVTNQQLEGDLFPGSLNIKELTNTSHINAGGKLFNRNTDGTFNMNKPIENISERNGFIFFDFMGGVFIPSPQVKEPSNMTNNGFTANWNPVDDAEHYTIELTEFGDQGNPQDNVLIIEEMDKFINEAGAGDGFNDLSSTLDLYMNHKGWSGLKVFTSQYGAKIGTSSVNGNLTSPPLLIKNGNITVTFSAKAYSKEDTSVEFILLNENDEIIARKEEPISQEYADYIVFLTDIEENDYHVVITSMSRFYIKNMAIFDGYYSYDNIADNNTMENTFLRPINKDIITDVLTTSYTFENLPSKNYGYRIMAHSNGSTSAWSEQIKLELTGETRVFSIMNNKNVQSEMYSLKGIKVNSPIHKGFYIIRNGSETKKVIIH